MHPSGLLGGFGRSREYLVRTDEGSLYDSKPIVGAAHGIQFPDRSPPAAADFSGGEALDERKLVVLGFEVVCVGEDRSLEEVGLVVACSRLPEGATGKRPRASQR
jgi:hypothetical protein